MGTLPIWGGVSVLFASRCSCLAHYVLHIYCCISIRKKEILWKSPTCNLLVLRENIRYRCGVQRRFEVYSIRSSGLTHHPACIETGKVHSCPSDTLEMAAMTSRFPSGHHWHGSTRVPSLKNRLVPTVAYKPNLSQLRTH